MAQAPQQGQLLDRHGNPRYFRRTPLGDFECDNTEITESRRKPGESPIMKTLLIYGPPKLTTIIHPKHIEVWDLPRGGYASVRGKLMLYGTLCPPQSGSAPPMPFCNFIVRIYTKPFHPSFDSTEVDPEWDDTGVEHVDRGPHSKVTFTTIRNGGGAYAVDFECQVPHDLLIPERPRSFCIKAYALYGSQRFDEPEKSEMTIAGEVAECTVENLISERDMPGTSRR